MAGWLSGAFFGGYVLVVPFLTAMTDRVDARYVFVLGALLSAGGLVGLAFLATGFWSALPWRVIAGAGLAGTYMPGLKVLTDRLPEARQPRAVASTPPASASAARRPTRWAAARSNGSAGAAPFCSRLRVRPSPSSPS